MTFRLALGFAVLFGAACFSSQPASTASAASGSGATDGGAVNCASLKIHSKSDFDACNVKCKSDQREQQSQCGDPNCQAGIGVATRVCLGKCDDEQKSAKQGNCFKDN